MQPQDTTQIKNPLKVMQTGETTICEIRRHPIGMLSLYGMFGFLLIGLAIIAFGVAPHYITSVDKSKVLSISTLVYFVFLLFSLGFLFIANKVYWGNRWVLTTDSLTQIQQTSLFNRQSSQLSLENLEDVTAEQNGILTHIFDYGVLKVETAGERSKFVFLYCPKPNEYAQQVLNAREAFEQHIRANEQQEYQQAQPAAAPQAPQAPLPPQQ